MDFEEYPDKFKDPLFISWLENARKQVQQQRKEHFEEDQSWKKNTITVKEKVEDIIDVEATHLSSSSQTFKPDKSEEDDYNNVQEQNGVQCDSTHSSTELPIITNLRVEDRMNEQWLDKFADPSFISGDSTEAVRIKQVKQERKEHFESCGQSLKKTTIDPMRDVEVTHLSSSSQTIKPNEEDYNNVQDDSTGPDIRMGTNERVNLIEQTWHNSPEDVTLPPIRSRKTEEELVADRTKPSFHSEHQMNAAAKDETEVEASLTTVHGVTMTRSDKCQKLGLISEKPLHNPEDVTEQIFNLLKHEKWEKKVKGLQLVRALAEHHSTILLPRLHDICIAVLKEAENNRSTVVQAAVVTLTHLFVHLQKEMDSLCHVVVPILRQKVSLHYEFIRNEADKSLSAMVYSCSPDVVMNTLLKHGLNHRSPCVRNHMTVHLNELVQVIGATQMLESKNVILERFIPAISKLALDSAQEVRSAARNTLRFLATDKNLLRLVDRFVPENERKKIKEIIRKAKSTPQISVPETDTRPCEPNGLQDRRDNEDIHQLQCDSGSYTTPDIRMETTEVVMPILLAQHKSPAEQKLPVTTNTKTETKPVANSTKGSFHFQSQTNMAAKDQTKVQARNKTVHNVTMKRTSKHQKLGLTSEKPLDNHKDDLKQIFNLLKHEKWEKKVKGLQLVQALAEHHSNILLPRLHDICIAVLKEAETQDSSLARTAIFTLSHLFVHLQKEMDKQCDFVAPILLHRVYNAKELVINEVDKALSAMVYNCSRVCAMKALLNGGLKHLSASVRKHMTVHLNELVQVIGATQLLAGKNIILERFMPAISKLALDPAQEVSSVAQNTLRFLATDKNLLRLVDRFVPEKEKKAIKEIIRKANSPHTLVP